MAIQEEKIRVSRGDIERFSKLLEKHGLETKDAELLAKLQKFKKDICKPEISKGLQTAMRLSLLPQFGTAQHIDNIACSEVNLTPEFVQALMDTLSNPATNKEKKSESRTVGKFLVGSSLGAREKEWLKLTAMEKLRNEFHVPKNLMPYMIKCIDNCLGVEKEKKKPLSPEEAEKIKKRKKEMFKKKFGKPGRSHSGITRKRARKRSR